MRPGAAHPGSSQPHRKMQHGCCPHPVCRGFAATVCSVSGPFSQNTARHEARPLTTGQKHLLPPVCSLQVWKPFPVPFHSLLSPAMQIKGHCCGSKVHTKGRQQLRISRDWSLSAAFRSFAADGPEGTTVNLAGGANQLRLPSRGATPAAVLTCQGQAGRAPTVLPVPKATAGAAA